jgi:hypothetical protein
MPRLAAVLVLLAAAAAGLLAPTAPSASTGAGTLVALRASADAAATRELRAAGATLIDRPLRLWRLPAGHERVVAALRRGAVRFVDREQRYARTAVTVTRATLANDPLSDQEWWRAQIGAAGLVAPGPGVPVTVVDSGVDLGHPELAGRPDLTTLNPQLPAPVGGTHGTMVSSLIGAPENGVGFVGVYPLARIAAWDAAPDNPNDLLSSEIVSGVLTAARAGRGVINLSLGGDRDLAVELAIDEAVARGSLVVAASGNSGEEGSPLSYPAAMPHVLTVGATTSTGAVASFSSVSPYVDVAAPGAAVLVARTLRDPTTGGILRDWGVADGTSFSTPLVAGAAAWIWTARPSLTADQVAETIRRTARDIGAPGRDTGSGWGLLDVGAALAAPPPVADLYEPNDDVDEVAPDGEKNLAAAPALTTRTRTKAALASRVDRYEDPADVYRVWLPAGRTVTITSTGTGDVDLALYRTGVTSVLGRFVGSYRLGQARTRSATRERLVVRNRAAGRWAYLSVVPAGASVDATYRVALSSR